MKKILLWLLAAILMILPFGVVAEENAIQLPCGVQFGMTLEEAAALKETGELAQHLLALDMPLQHLPRVDARPGLRKLVENGVKLPLNRVDGDELAEGQVTLRISADLTVMASSHVAMPANCPI